MDDRRPSARWRAVGIVRRAAAVAGLLALVAGVVAVATTAGAAPTWSVVASSTPTYKARGTLFDVACPTDTSCFGVGSYVNGGGVRQLIEHWNGTKWTVVPFTSARGNLSGIACPSASFCMAVGGSSSGMGAARWNGTTWAAAPLANPGASPYIARVACTSSTDCFAVGTKTSTRTTTVIEHWNGTAWSVVTSVDVPGTNSQLVDVACTSSSFCVAVGSSFDATSDPLIEQWNGISWSIVTTTEPDSERALNSVACTSATSCVAAGFDALTGSTLIKRWDGSMWSDDPSPNGSDPSADSNVLFDVACSTGANCFAVGIAFVNGTASTGILEQWNGVSWSLVSNPAASPAITGYASVTCPSAANCVTPAARGAGPQLLEHWNGSSWAAAGVPVDPTASNAILVDTACATPTTCFAVGRSTAGVQSLNPTRTLVERSSGSSWSVVTSANHAGEDENSLSSVSCPGPTTCFAVGRWGSGGAWRTLVERWNGSAWSIVTSPNVSRSSQLLTPNVLNGVSCTSTTSCFAVGTSYFSGYHTLVLRWNGKAWTVVDSPDRTSGENTLSDVSCTSPASCVAVGRTSPSNDGHPDKFATLAEHWNGKVWSIVATPNGPNGRGELAGVSCPSASACVAVGSSYRYATRSTLIESWNGASWKRVASADPSGKTHSALNGVSCRTAATCVAVGRAAGTASASRTLVKTLAGGHWTITASATPAGTRASAFSGVTCPSTRCFGVGTYDTDGSPRTLVERSS